MEKPSSPKFMIVPSLACQARCKYCFGPHHGVIMNRQVASKVVNFVESIVNETQQERVSITFHGGEPLLAPPELWEYMLSEFKQRLKEHKLSLHIQSNLWAFDDHFAKLFKDYGMKIGTSLDGPEKICDLTRGSGYWNQTMQGISKAREYNLKVGAIATISRDTIQNIIDIADFYRHNQLNMNLHPVVSAIGNDNSEFALSASEYTQVLLNLYPWYIKNRKNISISTLDNFCKAIVNGDPNVCTFKDCFGMFLAVDPNGLIYPCQRFCGEMEYSIGNVWDNHSLTVLYQHPNAQQFVHRQNTVKQHCEKCQFYSICKGGCYYNAISGGDGVIDPLCESYKKTYSFVQENLIDELTSKENIETITDRLPRENEHFLFRKGSYISLTRNQHPQQIASSARIILAIHDLANSGDPKLSAQNLFELGVCGNPGLTSEILFQISHSLHNPEIKLNNLYAHITFRCNLKCTHCYACAENNQDEMNPQLLDKLLNEASDCGFRQFIVTGGEPLIHSNIKQILDICTYHRFRGMNIILRTNLTGNYSESFLASIASAFDQVVASVDGNEETHDTRRGKGSYRILTENITRYQCISKKKSGTGELSVACVMRSDDIKGEPGQSVRVLANRNDIKRIRFRPLLPLGRAAHWDEALICGGILQHLSAEELMENGFKPLTTCGMGQNLYIEPNGNAFPCYAVHKPHTRLGNLEKLRLNELIVSDSFVRLSKCNVNTIEKCKDCEYRYLCGGACRAWGNEMNQFDLNAAPPNCDHLRKRAENLINAAKSYLLEIK